MSQNRCYKNPVSKYVHEYMYWRKQYDAGLMFAPEHYLEYFTIGFGVEKSFYDGKRILDIGCGPCGSLEWADNVARRVGVDPLAEAYEFIGADKHSMEYFPNFAEEIDTPDESFDIITTINSLDHVDTTSKVVGEIKRILAPGGHFFLMAEVSPHKKVCEPSPIKWRMAEAFQPEFELLEERQVSGFLLAAVKQDIAYDHDDPARPVGTLLLKMRKKG